MWGGARGPGKGARLKCTDVSSKEPLVPGGRLQAPPLLWAPTLLGILSYGRNPARCSPPCTHQRGCPWERALWGQAHPFRRNSPASKSGLPGRWAGGLGRPPELALTRWAHSCGCGCGCVRSAVPGGGTHLGCPFTGSAFPGSP